MNFSTNLEFLFFLIINICFTLHSSTPFLCSQQNTLNCYPVMSGIILKAQADPCESIFLPRSTECKVNFGGGKSECYQYNYETINATSQPYILDFELSCKKMHISRLTRHENLQNSVGKLRGGLSKWKTIEVKIIGKSENIMAPVSWEWIASDSNKSGITSSSFCTYPHKTLCTTLHTTHIHIHTWKKVLFKKRFAICRVT